jgi:glycosyltransferase involved in cell wall biosynthesis
MNVLFVTAYLPVLHRHGGGVRMYHNIRILSEKHSVHVLSFVTNDEEEDMLASLKSVCESAQGIRRVPDFKPHWFSVAPFLVREFSTPEMHRAVDSALSAKHIDVLQCEYLQMAQFHRKGVFSLLTAHEALSKNAREAYEAEKNPKQKLRLFYRWMQFLRYEVEQVRRFDRVVTMTKEDAAYLRSYARQADIRAIPIGIDPQEFRPTEDDASAALSVLFVGNYFHYPNVEAAEFLVQKIAPRLPQLRFLIAGSPVPEHMKAGPNVAFPGYISDTRTLYHGLNTIFVAPLFSGTGQRVKLLEAFAMGCPVVTTRVGAMGFPVEDGSQALIAETTDGFEAALRRLAADETLRRDMGNKARAMILQHFTWSRIGKELLDVIADAAVSN